MATMTNEELNELWQKHEALHKRAQGAKDASKRLREAKSLILDAIDGMQIAHMDKSKLDEAYFIVNELVYLCNIEGEDLQREVDDFDHEVFARMNAEKKQSKEA